MREVALVVHPERIHEFYRFIEVVQRERQGEVQAPILRVAMYGFGNCEQRAAVIYVVRMCFNTQWYYSSQTGEGRWEALLHFSSRDRVTLDSLQRLCDFFNVSVMVDDLGRCIDETLTTFVQRLDQGGHKTGWLRTKLRASILRLKHRMDQRDGNERVRQWTGMDWTTGNTIHFYNQWQNALLDFRRLQTTQALQRQIYTDAMQIYHAQNTEMRELLQKSQAFLLRCTNHIRDTQTCQDPLMSEAQTHLGHLSNYLIITSPPPPMPVQQDMA